MNKPEEKKKKQKHGKKERKPRLLRSSFGMSLLVQALLSGIEE